MAIPQPGVWGIDLGQCALKAVRLETVDGTVTATAFDYIEHPKILSQPDADPDELTREALQQFLSRNSIKGDTVVISVPGQSGLARFVKLPPVEEKKIADIVKFEAKQQIPFPLEEVVWDFQKIGQGVVTDGYAMETEIGLFAMKKDMVHRALQQFRDVKIEIHVIQMAPLALCNYVAYDLLHKDGIGGGDGADDTKECVVALDIGTDNSNLIITDGEKIIWQRPIPLGGNHFTRALTKDMKLTFAKAEHLKRNAVKSPDLKKILASLKTVLNDFVGEVQRSLGYFTNTHRDANIKYMIGLGNAFRLPGLQKYLQEKLQLEVRKLTKLERVTGEAVVSAPTFTENVMSFAVAYGLALQGEKLSRIQTNLLPYEIRVERIVRAKKPWAVAAAACLLLALGGLTFGYSVEKRRVDFAKGSEIKSAAEKAAASYKRVTGLINDYAEEEGRKTNAQKAIRQIGAGEEERFNWQQLYHYINMALPRPNGERLVDTARSHDPVKSQYFTKDAKDAYEKLENKRFNKKEQSLKLDDEEFIKAHLVQISIEGINTCYGDDLSTVWKQIKLSNDRLIGMTPHEQELVRKFVSGSETDALDAKAKLPTKRWVVEIRGYTYNKGATQFVNNTLMENLANPDGPKDNLSKDLKDELEAIRSKITFLTLLKNDQVPDPEPGKFKYIQTSLLPTLFSEPNADPKDPKRSLKFDPVAPTSGLNRDDWRPVGEVALAVFAETVDLRKKEGPIINQPTAVVNKDGGKRQPRTEFIIVFIWDEPLPAATAPPPGAPAALAAPAAPATLPNPTPDPAKK